MGRAKEPKAPSSLELAVKRLRAGEITPEEFVQIAAPYAVHEVHGIAHVDSGRRHRTGVAEAVLAEGKTDEALRKIVRKAVSASGRCLVTRIEPARALALRRALTGFQVQVDKRAHAVVVSNGRTKPPRTGGHVAILTAGSSDLRAAGEAKLTAEEQGCKVTMFADVGVAGIHRLFPALREVEQSGAHVVIVAAGMDGALPSVVAGLVSIPVIGLPVSTGYGVGGAGQAALYAILQSCAPGVAAVNIDNGFGAGALAAKISNSAVSAPRPAGRRRRQG